MFCRISGLGFVGLSVESLVVAGGGGANAVPIPFGKKRKTSFA